MKKAFDSSVWKMAAWLLFLSVSTASWSQNNDCNCSTTQALSMYNIGQFEALKSDLLNCIACSNKSMTNNKKNGFREMLSLTAIAQDSMAIAKQYIEQIIAVNPNYTPSTQNIIFLDLFRLIQTENSSITISSVSNRPESIRSTPATVEIISATDIQARGYVDLVELLTDLPGFEISKTVGINYANIYQLGYRQENSERTLLMIDGIEENDLWSNNAFLSRQYPISNIKAVEVIYGPASTIYGPRAFVGAINIITYTPNQKPKSYFATDKVHGPKSFYISGDVFTGSYNTKNIDVTFGNQPSKGSFKYQFSARYFSSDEADLSQQDFFDYDPADLSQFQYSHLNQTFDNSAETLQYLLENNLPLSSPYYTVDSNSIVLTSEGEALALERDLAAYNGLVNGNKLAYSNSTEDYFVGFQAQIDQFSFGARIWQRSEGLNSNQDLYAAGTQNGSNWTPTNKTFFVKYRKTFNDKFSFYLKSDAKVHSINNKTNSVTFSPFGIPSIYRDISDLINYNDDPNSDQYTKHGWQNNYYFYLAQQLRNEFRLLYTGKNLEAVVGIDSRFNSTQGDYFRSSNFNFRASTEEDYLDTVSLENAETDGTSYLTGSKNTFLIQDFGVYTQGSINYNKQIYFNFGIRYDNERAQGASLFDVITPRLGLAYVSKNVSIKSNFSRGYQNVSQWTKYSTAGGRVPNNNIKPEEINYGDLSISAYDQNDKFNSNLTLFGAKVKNGVASSLNSNGTSQNINSDNVGIVGLMLSLKYKTPSIRLDLNGTVFNPVQVDFQIKTLLKSMFNQSLDTLSGTTRTGDIAAYRANFGVTKFVNVKGINLSVNLRGNYVGDKNVGPFTTQENNPGLNGTNVIPAYFTLNSNVVLGFKKLPQLRFSVGINNITNEQYYHPGIRTASASFGILPQPSDQTYSEWINSSLTNRYVPYVQQRLQNLIVKLSLDF